MVTTFQLLFAFYCMYIILPPERYESNLAFQHTYRLALGVYRATETFPKREWYGGIAAQLRKAAFSVVSNIVEGSAKRGDAEYRRYLDISWGSLSETGIGLRFSHDYGFLDLVTFEVLYPQWREASKVTWGLYRSVSERLKRQKP